MVVTLGETDTLVPVTVPTVGLMLRLVAPPTAQDSAVLWPVVIADGSAAKLEMEGIGIETVTVTVAVLLPAALVAVSV